MEKKLDSILADLTELKITQAEIKKDIQYHIRRTDIAEENIELLRSEIKPISKHVERLNGGLKSLGVLAIILGIIRGVIEVFGS